MLNFNCALILLLMLRKYITWLRTKGGSLLLPLDHHIDIHKLIGVIILIESILHTVAHLAYVVYVFTLCSLPTDHGFPCQSNVAHLQQGHLSNRSIIDSSLSTIRYRFDHTINKCEPFQYHGCGGNWNNFLSESKCQTRCSEKIHLERFLFSFVNLEPYHLASHSYIDALFTFKLGLGYITGVIELVIGAVFYVMCLPFVRKTGHFQVQRRKKK